MLGKLGSVLLHGNTKGVFLLSSPSSVVVDDLELLTVLPSYHSLKHSQIITEKVPPVE